MPPPEPAAAAEELGYFEENCIDAEIMTFAAGINALRALQAGQIEIAVPPTASTINAVGEGSPIVGWLSPASQLPQLILASEEVTSCEDLEGRTAATGGPGDLVDHLMATYARTCGLELTQDIDVYIGSAADYGPVMAQGVAQASALAGSPRAMHPCVGHPTFRSCRRDSARSAPPTAQDRLRHRAAYTRRPAE